MKKTLLAVSLILAATTASAAYLEGDVATTTCRSVGSSVVCNAYGGNGNVPTYASPTAHINNTMRNINELRIGRLQIERMRLENERLKLQVQQEAGGAQ